MSKKKQKVRRVYTKMEGYEVKEQPESIDSLPPAFKEAHALWKTDKKKNLAKVIKLLQPFVSARFLPGRVSGWQDLFVEPPSGEDPEFEALEVHLLGVEYGAGPLPSATAGAMFEVPVTNKFARVNDFGHWQANNGMLESGVLFGWNIPRTEATAHLDFTNGTYSARGCLTGDYGDEAGPSWTTSL